MHLKLSVKEMEKISGVSSRTLRYYDSIDLFKPSGVHSNGYRYYTIDKIEEIHFISYMRHIGVSIKEIKSHLENRNIEDYEHILKDHLKKIHAEIQVLEFSEQRIKRRIAALEYIKNLPEMGVIRIEALPCRRILELKKNLIEQADWEFSLTELEKKYKLPPSMFIGDLGFFVDLSRIEVRGAEEFTGLYLLAEDSYFNQVEALSVLEAGLWLTLYIKGDHNAARREYIKLVQYAKTHGLTLGSFALERTVIDHYISTCPDYYITEIQIPITHSIQQVKNI